MMTTTTIPNPERESVRGIPAEPGLLQEALGDFSGKRLLEAIQCMAEEHFRRMDEIHPQQPIDKEAERAINALFEEHAAECDALQALLDQN